MVANMASHIYNIECNIAHCNQRNSFYQRSEVILVIAFSPLAKWLKTNTFVLDEMHNIVG